MTFEELQDAKGSILTCTKKIVDFIKKRTNSLLVKLLDSVQDIYSVQQLGEVTQKIIELVLQQIGWLDNEKLVTSDETCCQEIQHWIKGLKEFVALLERFRGSGYTLIYKIEDM